MRVRPTTTIAVLLTAALCIAACGSDDERSFSETTLRFTERETDNFGFTDAPPKTEMGAEGPSEFSNGDQLTFSSDLLDGSDTDVGVIDVTCTVTRPGDFQDCDAVQADWVGPIWRSCREHTRKRSVEPAARVGHSCQV